MVNLANETKSSAQNALVCLLVPILDVRTNNQRLLGSWQNEAGDVAVWAGPVPETLHGPAADIEELERVQAAAEAAADAAAAAAAAAEGAGLPCRVMHALKHV
jgi:hypothetical protein